MHRQKEYKEKASLSRMDIAARLRSLAQAVEQGAIYGGQMEVRLPSQARYRLELEPRELELEIKWG